MTSILDQAKDPITIDPEKDYLPELVGEGKTYTTEKDLARAVVEKEAFIQRTTRENAELREDLKASRATKRLEDMLDQLQALQTIKPPSNDDNQDSEPKGPSPQTLTPEDVMRLIQKRDDARTQEQNRNAVIEKLTSVYGDNYVSKVKETASQLKVGPEFLDNLALSNPQAFFKLMDLDKKPETDTGLFAPPRSMTTVPATSSKRNWAYYENMRKKEPTRYHTIQIQNEMHNEAQKAFKEGKDFYSA